MTQVYFQNYTTGQRKGFNLFDILKSSILSAHQLIEPARSFGANDSDTLSEKAKPLRINLIALFGC